MEATPYLLFASRDGKVGCSRKVLVVLGVLSAPLLFLLPALAQLNSTGLLLANFLGADEGSQQFFSYRLNSDIDSWEVQLDLNHTGVVDRRAFLQQLYELISISIGPQDFVLTLDVLAVDSSRQPSPTGQYSRTIWTSTAAPDFQIRHRVWEAGWHELTAKMRRVQDHVKSVQHFRDWAHSGKTQKTPWHLPSGASWSKWRKLENDVHCGIHQYGEGGDVSFSTTVINASGAFHIGDVAHQIELERYWPGPESIFDELGVNLFSVSKVDYSAVYTRRCKVGGCDATMSTTFGYGTAEAMHANNGALTGIETSARIFAPTSPSTMGRVLKVFNFLRRTRLNGEVAFGCDPLA